MHYFLITLHSHNMFNATQRHQHLPSLLEVHDCGLPRSQSGPSSGLRLQPSHVRLPPMLSVRRLSTARSAPYCIFLFSGGFTLVVVAFIAGCAIIEPGSSRRSSARALLNTCRFSTAASPSSPAQHVALTLRAGHQRRWRPRRKRGALRSGPPSCHSSRQRGGNCC
jgi:hypothetical protein